MIKVTFDPEKLDGDKLREWKNLEKDAVLATQNVIEQWEEWLIAYNDHINSPGAKPPEFKPEFDDDVWKAVRDWLVENVFNNKCAYCETFGVGFISDTEHFRPKGRVSSKAEGVVKITHFDGTEMSHPGYFWLAYNWKNLLPSCQVCNRNGKRDYFPVGNRHVAVVKLTRRQIRQLRYQTIKHSTETDVYFLETDDLNRIEDAQLLHPYNDQPSKHLIFGVDGSVLPFNNSIKGEQSIEIYNLNEKNLVAARRREQNNAFRDYLDAIKQAVGGLDEKQDAARSVINKYVKGESPYAAAIIDYIHAILKDSPIDPKALYLAD